MNVDDWEMIWKRQELPRGSDADLAMLRQTFDAKSRKAANALFARDVLEASAGIFVSAALAFLWWKQGKAGWPIAGAIVLMLSVTVVFVRERFRVRRARARADAPLLVRLEFEIDELHYQRRLFSRIWIWYFGPCLAAVVIVGETIRRSRPAWDVSHDPLFTGSFYALFLALVLWAWWVNRRAVRRQLEPRIAELEKLRSDLLAS